MRTDSPSDSQLYSHLKYKNSPTLPTGDPAGGPVRHSTPFSPKPSTPISSLSWGVPPQTPEEFEAQSQLSSSQNPTEPPHTFENMQALFPDLRKLLWPESPGFCQHQNTSQDRERGYQARFPIETPQIVQRSIHQNKLLSVLEKFPVSNRLMLLSNLSLVHQFRISSAHILKTCSSTCLFLPHRNMQLSYCGSGVLVWTRDAWTD